MTGETVPVPGSPGTVKPSGPRDIVVVGASAGGVEALVSLVGGLQREMHAALFVVLHMATDARSALAYLLSRASPLPVVVPRDGEAIRLGRVYVARPNYHLLLEPGRIRVLAGPRENGARPAVDPLFRSAAWAYGERVVGVVLSGTMDDGTAGARTIRRHGGAVVVQSDALFDGMPQSVLESVPVDRALPAAQIGPLLVGLAARPSEGETTVSEQTDETSEAAGAVEDELLEDQMAKNEGQASGFTCPECNGSLWERVEADASGGSVMSFECRVSHKYTFETLVAAKALEVEAAVWAAINALEERAALLRKSAARARARGLSTAAVPERMIEQARESEQHAEAIRRTLLGSVMAVGTNGADGDALREGDVGPISA